MKILTNEYIQGGKIMFILFTVKRILGLSLSIFTVMFVLLSAVSSVAQTEEMSKDKGLKVTILLFSGRPNPVYLLEEEELIAEVKDLIGKAAVNKDIKEGTVIPSRLGYSGILVENQGKIPELPPRLAIYKGNIELRDEQVKYLKDEGTLENFLLDKAVEKEVIDEKALKFIKTDKQSGQ
jgi:hypothetical protein